MKQKLSLDCIFNVPCDAKREEAYRLHFSIVAVIQNKLEFLTIHHGIERH